MTRATHLAFTFALALGLTLVAGCPQPAEVPDATAFDAGGDGGVCFPLPADSDHDNISNAHENASAGVNTNGDGTPDYLDDDSDDDTILDIDEAGDDNPCTPPLDTDDDGIPNFRENDSDANGIADAAELTDTDGDGVLDYATRDDDGDGIRDLEEWGADPNHPIDSDGDTIPDYHDTDSDNDAIPDRKEGVADADGDGVPAYLDDDSDGDGLSDTLEAGDDPSRPTDSDRDGTFDFLDVDSDNDGLSDGQEDPDGDGVLDPGESDRLVADTDGDGYLDVVEWAAGTDPQDPLSGLSADDFYFLLPYYDAEKEDDLNFSTDIIKADVLFLCDNTGSMGGTIETLQNTLQTVIVPGLALEIDNVAMGVASFRDFPLGSFGGSSDWPYRLEQRLTTNVDAVQTGLDRYVAGGGADGDESDLEAIYQAVTGEGISWDVGGVTGSVPKFNPYTGYNPALGHGLLGGAGFRVGALPIIVLATDITWHEAGDYWTYGITAAHTRDQAVAAAQALGARFIGITSDASARVEHEQVARETQAMVPPTAWGPGETLCHTGEGGSPRPPDATGLCPLVFDMAYGGDGVNVQVVDAIQALVTYGTIDISGVPVSDPYQLPAVDTAQFITNITPLPPAPPGSTIDGDIFREVQPGVPVTFTVHARNTIVPSRAEAQLFRVTIRVMGDAVTVLDERDVYIVIPGGGGPG